MPMIAPAIALAPQSVLRVVGITVDVDRHLVTVGRRRRRVDLTRKEFELLRFFLVSGGRVLSRERIIARLWPDDPDTEIDARTVDQHIRRLRDKIGWQRIETVAGYGYRLATGK